MVALSPALLLINLLRNTRIAIGMKKSIDYKLFVGGFLMKDLEQIVQEVNSSMAMEGMPLSEDDKDRIRSCLRDDRAFEKTLKSLLLKHTVGKPA